MPRLMVSSFMTRLMAPKLNSFLRFTTPLFVCRQFEQQLSKSKTNKRPYSVSIYDSTPISIFLHRLTAPGKRLPFVYLHFGCLLNDIFHWHSVNIFAASQLCTSCVRTAYLQFIFQVQKVEQTNISIDSPWSECQKFLVSSPYSLLVCFGWGISKELNRFGHFTTCLS